MSIDIPDTFEFRGKAFELVTSDSDRDLYAARNENDVSSLIWHWKINDHRVKSGDIEYSEHPLAMDTFITKEFYAVIAAQTKEESVTEFKLCDPVNSPAHYQSDSGLEAIEVIDAFFADNFNKANVFKYLARAGRKTDGLEDLKKARWYLDHEINKEEEAQK